MKKEVKEFVEIYMREYRPSVKKYEITDYTNYEYFHSVDIEYRLKNNDKVLFTLEFTVSDEKMFDKVLEDKSIKLNTIGAM